MAEDWLVQINRRQLPIKLSIAIAINKAQGQSMNNLGVYLHQPVYRTDISTESRKKLNKKQISTETLADTQVLCLQILKTTTHTSAWR